ncbi:hypothetical protein DPMN_136141 [Dreissena polymorpha]|uniref:Uncharacterized protein n=1 Tax=Dreissena polymorpha TaxID=45954 RepID=A0A9D4G328_DREPO|nr:hypothetical protein DPMN_136141 [Dreissena polymorpha]
MPSAAAIVDKPAKSITPPLTLRPLIVLITAPKQMTPGIPTRPIIDSAQTEVVSS